MSSSNNPYTTPRDVNTSWIHDVVAHLKNAGQPSGPLLNCTCVVCLESTLDISACVGDMIKDELAAAEPVDSIEKFYEKYKLEPTAFLRCGHIVGASCLAKFEIGQMGVCPVCRDQSCDGCDWQFHPILVKDMVPWPLSTADYRPVQKFLSSVTLTTAEIAAGTKRFCTNCMVGQYLREWFRLTKLFPGCPACDAARRGGAGADYPADHGAWRRANVDRWIRQQLGRVAEVVYPSAADLRDPAARGAEEAAVATRRRAFVARFLFNQDLVDPLRRVLYLPCEQVGEEEAAPLSHAEMQRIARSCRRAGQDRRAQYFDSGVAWFRGVDDGFRHGPADADAERDPVAFRQELAEVAGVGTFVQALLNVNPMALPNVFPLE